MSRNHAKMFQSATLSIAVLLVLLVATPQVVSHSVLISPMPRNAVDRVLPAWRGGKFGNTTCEHPSTENSTTQKPVRTYAAPRRASNTSATSVPPWIFPDALPHHHSRHCHSPRPFQLV